MAINKKELVEIGAVGIAGLVLFVVFFRHRGSNVAAAQGGNVTIEPGRAYGPEYYLYNLPQVEGPPSQAGELNPANQAVVSQTTGANAPTCGCSGGSQDQFSGENDFINYLQNRLGGFLNTYEDNVMSGLPDWFRSYINNTTGSGLSQQTATFFSG